MRRERTEPAFSLAVQYATRSDVPARASVRRWVRSALSALAPERGARYALTVRFVDADEGRTLNRTFRGRDGATNVLTFAASGEDGVVSADIAICVPVVEREARAQGKPVAAHMAHLVVHGVLHAAGHDHGTDDEADAMEAIERAVLARFRIADPYRPA